MFILASWEDVYRQVFQTELYEAGTNTEDILDACVQAKSEFGRGPVTRDDTRVSFDDGSQVSLSIIKLSHVTPKYRKNDILELEGDSYGC